MKTAKMIVFSVAKWILFIEPLVLLVVVAVFFTPNMERLHTLWLLVPPLIARLILHKRLGPISPLNIVIAILITISVLNLFTAPMQWGGMWDGGWIIGRIVMGAAMAFSISDRAVRLGTRGIQEMLFIAVIFGVLLGIAALWWSIWTEKSTQLLGLIALLPTRPVDEWFRQAIGGFNVNEVGGAIAFVLPMVAGITFIDWRTPITAENRWLVVRRWIGSIAFALLAFALFLGQSRMAIAGSLVALTGLTFLIIPRGRWRLITIAGLVAFTAVELVLFTQVTNPEGEVLLERDESSVTSRVQIWTAAANIVIDHPLTGLGMNQFRSRAARAQYPVEGYEDRVLPHAHNAVLQLGADYGVPGILLFFGLFGTAGWMLWRVWRARGQNFLLHTAAAVGAGLLSHAIFGLADAITLFDRFIFIFWWLLGAAIALYGYANAQPALQRSEATARTIDNTVTKPFSQELA